MIRSSLRRFVGTSNFSRDLIGILLALVIGIGGQIFVFSIPDPFVVLAPQIPLLSPPDWPGSHASIGLGISTEWRWREKREFQTELELINDTYSAYTRQKVVWYADPMETAAAWNQLNTESYNEQPIVASFRGNDKPASMLFCRKKDLPDDPHECWYLAYWEHWYTEVIYWSQIDDDLQSLEMQQIATRVDQLLMSAPDEPCYGILCTGTGEVGNAGR